MRDDTLEHRTIGRVLAERAARIPDRTFLIWQGRHTTYGEVEAITNRYANGFAAHGIGHGDHVAVMLPNCPEFLWVIWGLGKVGAVAVPLNTAVKGELLHYFLDQSDASDQDSWTVTQAFADTYGLTDIASLASVTEPITVGGNSELETRPYGPTALKEKYGIDIAGFTPVEDNGGPLTVKALVDNTIQLANIYTADPNIVSNDLVALDDPDGLFFPDNVVPVVSDKVDDGATEIINAVSAKLSADVLVSLNAQSVNDQAAADTIATDWLTKEDLI